MKSVHLTSTERTLIRALRRANGANCGTAGMNPKRRGKKNAKRKKSSGRRSGKLSMKGRAYVSRVMTRARRKSPKMRGKALAKAMKRARNM